ncbi:MAG: phage tail baseplate protein, partial [Pseudomonadota bacterium]
SARALAARLAGAAADGRDTMILRADLAAAALTVGQVVTLADGSGWRLAERTMRGNDIWLELKRYQPLPADEVPADPGAPVGAPDWPDAVGTVHVLDLPNLGSPAASAPHVLIAGAGSNDGWRGADCWFVPAPGAEPIAIGTARPAAALGHLTALLAAGSASLFDLANAVLVELVNPAMTLESVSDAALLGGANRAMLGGELLQFGRAEIVAPGVWRLSRLLRGRAGTDAATIHAAGEPFVLLDDPAALMLPEMLADWAESGGAMVQWASRGGAALNEVAVPAAGRALRPLAPVHGRVSPDGAGGAIVRWVRRSRVDNGWRDHVELPLGESREAWRAALAPPAPGIGPWTLASPLLAITADELAAVPPGTAIEVRQVGDFDQSPPLFIPLT